MPRAPRSTASPDPGAGRLLAEREALRALPLFQELDDEELEALAAQAVVRSFGRGEAIVKAGMEWDALVILLSGRVRILQSRLGLAQYVMDDAGPGCPLTLPTVLDGLPCPSTIQGTEAGEYMFVPGGALREVFERHPEVVLRMLKAVSRRLRRFVQSLGALTLLNLEERLALFLIRDLDDGGAGHCFPLSHEEIGQRVGGSREEVTRILSRWKKEGLVSVGYRKVTVEDPAAIAKRIPELPDLQLF